MKKLLFACWISSLFGYDAYIGPHFNYIRVNFNTPSYIEGYMGGITAGIAGECRDVWWNLHFEGSWNAGPITGQPCERSDLEEYFLELKVGYPCWHLKPYIGFGWDRFINTKAPDTAHLKYRYDKLFIPLGVAYECGCWAIEFEWRPDVWSQLNLIGIDLDPRWGHAFRVQVPIRQCVKGCFSIEFVPFFDWNRFGKVRLKNSSGATYVIPRLSRWDLGLRLLIGYRF